jgi:hypothetical protein
MRERAAPGRTPRCCSPVGMRLRADGETRRSVSRCGAGFVRVEQQPERQSGKPDAALGEGHWTTPVRGRPSAGPSAASHPGNGHVHRNDDRRIPRHSPREQPWSLLDPPESGHLQHHRFEPRLRRRTWGLSGQAACPGHGQEQCVCQGLLPSQVTRRQAATTAHTAVRCPLLPMSVRGAKL